VRRQPIHAGEQTSDFLPRQDDGHVSAAAGAEGFDVTEVEVEHIAVEEEEGGESLVLRAGRHPALDGEVRKEAFDFLGARRVGMAEARRHLVEADVLFDQAEVAALGFEGQAAEAGDLAAFVEQLHGRFLPRRGGLSRLRARVMVYRAPSRNRRFVISYRHEAE